MTMRFGFVVPSGDADAFARCAVACERAGWDAVFTWEAVWTPDAWVAMAVAAERTERIRLGTMLTPLPRVKPWELAARAASLDRVSGGRLQLAVGLGAVHGGWTAFEPDVGRQVRAQLLDEGLAIYSGLMAGQPFGFEGEHYTVRPTSFAPPPAPVQQPRVPVWVVGGWVEGRERQPSVDRAARYDGLLPQLVHKGDGAAPPFTPDRLAGIVEHVREVRSGLGLSMDGYDVVVEAPWPGNDEVVDVPAAEWAGAGATFMTVGAWDLNDGDAVLRPGAAAELDRRIAAGPPRG